MLSIVMLRSHLSLSNENHMFARSGDRLKDGMLVIGWTKELFAEQRFELLIAKWYSTDIVIFAEYRAIT